MSKGNPMVIQQLFQQNLEALLTGPCEAEAYHEGIIDTIRQTIPARFEVERNVGIFQHRDVIETPIAVYDRDNFPAFRTQQGDRLLPVQGLKIACSILPSWRRSTFENECEVLWEIENRPREVVQSLRDEVDELNKCVNILIEGGEPNMSMLAVRPPIATVVIIVNGGPEDGIGSLTDEIRQYGDTSWPDLVVFLTDGTIMERVWPEGLVRVLEYQELALMGLAHHLLRVLAQRTVSIEGIFTLEEYFLDRQPAHVRDVEFKPTHLWPYVRKI